MIVRHVAHYSILLADHPEKRRSTAEIHPEPAIPWQAVYFRLAAYSDIPILQSYFVCRFNSQRPYLYWRSVRSFVVSQIFA